MSLKKGHYNKQFSFTGSDGREGVSRAEYDYEYLIDYHPWHSGNNPLYDDNSRLINHFKKGYTDAVEHFARLIDQNYSSDWYGCYCVAVPSHDPTNNFSSEQASSEQKVSTYELLVSDEKRKTAVYDLIAFLVDKHKDLHNGSAVLIRTKDTVSKSSGGDRSVSIGLSSIEVNSNCGIDLSGKNILLIDDVITTGNSIAACRMILKEAGAKSVFVLCLGKTARDSIVRKDSEGSPPSTADVPFDEEVPF